MQLQAGWFVFAFMMVLMVNQACAGKGHARAVVFYDVGQIASSEPIRNGIVLATIPAEVAAELDEGIELFIRCPQSGEVRARVITQRRLDSMYALKIVERFGDIPPRFADVVSRESGP